MRRHALAFAFVFVFVTACSHPSDLVDAGLDAGPAGDDAGVIDGGADDAGVFDDAGVADAGGADAGARDAGLLITSPAVHATSTLPFAVDISGHGHVRLGPISVQGDVGSVILKGEHHSGFAYQTHQFAGLTYTLYDFLSVADDGSDLAVSYLYCDGPNLTDAYTESLRNPMAEEAATGTCDGGMTATSITVDMPALAATVTPFDPGIVIEGTDLNLGPDGGAVAQPGGTYTLLPFNTVDCTTCPAGPWLEIHSVLTNASESCFGIIYLFPDTPTKAQLSYELCLPSLAQPPSEAFTVTWSGTLKAAKRANNHPPLRPPPPGR